MVILTAMISVLWLLLMFGPALGDWSTGDWIILVNNDLADPQKVLEFNTGNPNYPVNLHPVFMADGGPGSIPLQTSDYWYVTVNTDNSYKIHNANNGYALDTASDGTTPVILPLDDQAVQGCLIQQNADGTFSIYNHGLDKYLGLISGGWPAYMAPDAASYTHWSFLTAVETSFVTATSTQTITSTNAVSTSLVTGPSLTSISTVFATTTQVITLLASAPAVAQRAKRWVNSIAILTTSITTTTVIYVDGPLVYVIVPAGTAEVIVTSVLTVVSTFASSVQSNSAVHSKSAVQSVSGTLSSSSSSPISSRTSSAAQTIVTTTNTQSSAAQSGARKRYFNPTHLILGSALALVVLVL